LSVFLSLDADRKDLGAVERTLKQSTAVRSLRFVPKDEALAQMKRNEGIAEIASLLKNNPLPDAFIADLRPGAAQAAEALVKEIRALPKVAQVQLDMEWLQRLERLLNLGKLAVGLLALLLAFALVAVTFNTVRMQILTQRDEIEVSRLVGATNAYIRRPFYYQGALLGLLGGALALALVGAAGGLLNPQVHALAQSYGSEFSLRLPPYRDLLAILAFAAMLGWLGSWLSVSRHLQSFKPR
jgi:cell division transport system permease protein